MINWVLRYFSIASNRRPVFFIIIVLIYHRILVRSRHFGVAPDLSDLKNLHFLVNCVS